MFCWRRFAKSIKWCYDTLAGVDWIISWKVTSLHWFDVLQIRRPSSHHKALFNRASLIFVGTFGGGHLCSVALGEGESRDHRKSSGRRLRRIHHLRLGTSYTRSHVCSTTCASQPPEKNGTNQSYPAANWTEIRILRLFSRHYAMYKAYQKLQRNSKMFLKRKCTRVFGMHCICSCFYRVSFFLSHRADNATVGIAGAQRLVDRWYAIWAREMHQWG